MKNFNEWLSDNHPEFEPSVNEFFGMFGGKSIAATSRIYNVESFIDDIERALERAHVVPTYGNHEAKATTLRNLAVNGYKDLFYKYGDLLDNRWGSEAPKTHSRRWLYADNWVHKDKEGLYKLIWAIGKIQGHEEEGKAREIRQRLLDEVVQKIKKENPLPQDSERIGTLGKQMYDRDVSGNDYEGGGPRAYVSSADREAIMRRRSLGG